MMRKCRSHFRIFLVAYERIAFTVTIYEAEARRQNFGQVSNAYIRIVDQGYQPGADPL